MKISNDEAVRASSSIDPVAAAKLGSQTPASTIAKSTAPGTGPAAQIELSAQAKALTAAKTEAASYVSAVNAAPDTRDTLVSKLKAQVDNGTYHVSSADIADQIVRRAQADRIQ
ncbi:MAG: flagellar biosynthesis anti-sigma factor FlgM [Janthinobacterium lividum]